MWKYLGYLESCHIRGRAFSIICSQYHADASYDVSKHVVTPAIIVVIIVFVLNTRILVCLY